jgi:hypothetical protein
MKNKKKNKIKQQININNNKNKRNNMINKINASSWVLCDWMGNVALK